MSPLIDGQDEPTDPMSVRLRREALEALADEPELCSLLHRTVLAPGVVTFEDAVSMTVCYRMLMVTCNDKVRREEEPMFCPNSLRTLIHNAMMSNSPTDLEMGHTMSEAVRLDALAVCDRDPACDTLLEVVLFYKGFSALVCHRAARVNWYQAKAKNKRSFTALFLQSQASAVFGLDIHPAATIGAAILFDHGTGIVIGETACIGDGSTLLHGVTLGGTGKQGGDRHPKVGKNVLIGAGSSILGNIIVGDGAKIGAGSVVLRPIPAGATAVGAPAKVIGRAQEEKPGSDMDDTLQHVTLLHKSESVLKGMSEKATKLLKTSKKQSLSESSSTPSVTSTSDSENDEEDSNERQRRRSFCPFREYTKMAKSAPEGSITIETLRKKLAPIGCTDDEIGQIFFVLDKTDVGHFYWRDISEDFADVLGQYTSLDLQQIQDLVGSLSAPPSVDHQLSMSSE